MCNLIFKKAIRMSRPATRGSRRVAANQEDQVSSSGSSGRRTTQKCMQYFITASLPENFPATENPRKTFRRKLEEQLSISIQGEQQDQQLEIVTFCVGMEPYETTDLDGGDSDEEYISNYSANGELFFLNQSSNSSLENRLAKFHIHSYTQFNVKVDFEIMRQVVLSMDDGNWAAGLDIQSVKNKSKVIKYITKLDTKPYSNMSTSTFSFQYQIYMWAYNNYKNPYNPLDPFVVKNQRSANFLQSYLAAFSRKMESAVEPSLQPSTLTYNCPWTIEVTNWFNEKLRTFRHKDPQLYLWGDSNVGKSYFVEKILVGSEKSRRIYYPERSKWAFSTLDVSFHELILFEEADFSNISHGNLKRLLEGSSFSAEVKYGNQKDFAWEKPIIFVSNYPPQHYSVDQALLNRLKVVHATEPYFINYSRCYSVNISEEPRQSPPVPDSSIVNNVNNGANLVPDEFTSAVRNSQDTSFSTNVNVQFTRLRKG
ncbi:uncharacterized protein LOC123306337 [Coccinella septempunctata]|uniref:uncharacterized protein LOC123306337 n=1 Tax=Coccinella septempunctata TaxID=41139 RepID=UPI001D077F44|nr:uncharacterized protein LOC123306337 [Coccinella septempunctata]